MDSLTDEPTPVELLDAARCGGADSAALVSLYKVLRLHLKVA